MQSNWRTALVQQYGGRVTSHTRFGTAKWRLEGCSFASATQPGVPDDLALKTLDLVTARTEFYTYPSALPTVERGSIKLDLHRRDFTSTPWRYAWMVIIMAICMIIGVG